MNKPDEKKEDFVLFSSLIEYNSEVMDGVSLQKELKKEVIHEQTSENGTQENYPQLSETAAD